MAGKRLLAGQSPSVTLPSVSRLFRIWSAAR